MRDATQNWQTSRTFLDAEAHRLQALAPNAAADNIDRIVSSHQAWRDRVLNLNPAEGLISARSRKLLDSDLATRLTEGLPGAKVYPHGSQNDYVDELEAILINQARRLFGARYVEWRATSTSMANACVFFGLLERGDTIMAQSEESGGNYSYHEAGPAGLAGLNVVDIPWQGEAFEIDLDALRTRAREVRPSLIVVGGSNVLFPYPVRELRTICDEVGAWLLYDAAHLGLHIGAGTFQRPLEEGAHIVTLSTHKVMGGPVGGLLLTDNSEIARHVADVIFPGFLQTRDQNKYAACALSLTESVAFGGELSRQMIVNARALGRALAEEGFQVVAGARGGTQTHQLFLELGKDAQRLERHCHGAGILLSDTALVDQGAAGMRNGARLATHEVTRLGMKEWEMQAIARLISRAYRGENTDELADEVSALRRDFLTVRYSFDGDGS